MARATTDAPGARREAPRNAETRRLAADGRGRWRTRAPTRDAAPRIVGEARAAPRAAPDGPRADAGATRAAAEADIVEGAKAASRTR